MNIPHATEPISPLRQRLIDDMDMRKFSPKTQSQYSSFVFIVHAKVFNV